MINLTLVTISQWILENTLSLPWRYHYLADILGDIFNLGDDLPIYLGDTIYEVPPFSILFANPSFITNPQVLRSYLLEASK